MRNKTIIEINVRPTICWTYITEVHEIEKTLLKINSVIPSLDKFSEYEQASFSQSHTSVAVSPGKRINLRGQCVDQLLKLHDEFHLPHEGVLIVPAQLHLECPILVPPSIHLPVFLWIFRGVWNYHIYKFTGFLA